MESVNSGRPTSFPVADSMTKKISLVVAMLMLLALMPGADASFTKPPTFDLTASSNLVSATDAAYSLYLANPDPSENAIGVSIVIPAGYSVGQQFITSKAGIQVGSGGGTCQMGSGEGPVKTTTTPGRFSMSAGGMTIGEIIITQPTMTSQGKMEVSFSGPYSSVNHGCNGGLEMGKGFFINPSTPGTYAWAPSIANPKSGPPVTMAPRSGYSQSVTIVSSATTTTGTTDISEFSSVLTVVFALVLALPVAIIRKKSTSPS
jgi:hypothetical protein